MKMLNRLSLSLLSLSFVFLSFSVSAQILPTEHAPFLEAIVSRLDAASKKGSKSPKAAAEGLQKLWISENLPDEEKDKLIEHVNIMAKKKYATAYIITDYLLAVISLKSETNVIKIDIKQFFDVTGQCLKELEQKRVKTYLENLVNYLPRGHFSNRSRIQKTFRWKATETEPRLKFMSIKDKGKSDYKAPIIRLGQTDLLYQSDADSTWIYNTTGDYNLISQTFLGLGGKVTWEKVGLPGDDVFVLFKAYKANFRSGFLKVDSVTFYYKSLIDKPLVGYFEDKNFGHKSVTTANYPSFQSYEGGVVIKNIVPDVNYEGAFSLKGVRKIGTSFFIWTDYVPEPMEEGDFIEENSTEEARDDQWDDWGTSSSEDESQDDGYWDDYGSDYETDTDDSFVEWGESSTEDSQDDGYEEEVYEDEDAGWGDFPDKIQKKIKAKLQLMRGDTEVIRLRGDRFVLDEQKMIAKNLEAAVYLSDNDSLYHPSMDLLYAVGSRKVTLKKPRRGILGRMPFTSSFHEFYLYFEAIIWDLNKDKIEFTAFIDKENKRAAIESFSFFNKMRFDGFKNMLKFSPIGAIYRYSVKNPNTPIFPVKILEEYKLMNQQIAFEQTLPSMVSAGFIQYNAESKEVTPLPKLFHWARSARKKTDFDAIQLTSAVDTGSHASMSVIDKMIELNGCQFFSLSDSQYLRVVPFDEHVKVGKNRDMEFGGAMAAGKLNFYGSKPNSFHFDYESFRIECDSLDSMRFVIVRNPPMGYEMTPLQKALRKTVFENISGSIHIDAPNNKSGSKDRPHFPVFDSYSSAYLYWNKPHIQEAIYHKDSLYFALEPFVLDSLDDFDETKLNFDGEFYSAEIFPRFRQSLVVMEDFSLGFKETAPANGYYIYNNKGLFFNEITMNEAGLTGNGEIEIFSVDVKVQSDSFTFHFDSVMAVVRDFHRDRGFRAGAYYPQVDANKAQYVWYTKKDRLILRSMDEPISIFGGEASFEGELVIREEGMHGSGALTVGQIRIESDSIKFNEMDFSTPSADFVIIDKEDPELRHFVAEDVTVNYDIYSHTSTFEGERDSSQIKAHFPIHQYRTSMAKGTYNREFNELKLEGLSSYIRDNFFQSTSLEQDSLMFSAKESYYMVNTRSIDVKGVPAIYVADAAITPDKLEVTIQENGLIKRLENAIIEADVETKLHKVYEANIDIYSSSEYEGEGKYDYIKVKNIAQYINFNNIRVDSDTITTASGGIAEEQNFYLTDRIRFRGMAFLDASERFLEFEGEVKIESDNPAFKGNWFQFRRTVVNPDSVFIPIQKDLRDPDGSRLTAGLNFIPENRVFYSNFLQTIKNDDDKVIITAEGGLTFDRSTKEFRIGSEDKLKGKSYKGATVSFDDDKNVITSHGILQFPGHFPKNTTTLKIVGSWRDDLRKRELSTNLIMSVKGNIIPKDPLKKVTDNLLYLTTNNTDIDFKQRNLMENIAELLDEGKTGEKETLAFEKEVKNAMVTSDIKLAERFPVLLFLSNVNFNYSREYKSLYCDTEVGVVGINGQTINKMIPAKIVYKFGAAEAGGEKIPDRLDILLEVDEFNWLYFRFQDQVVWTSASYYDDYVAPLQVEIEKRKKAESYRYELAGEEMVSEFKQNFVKKFIIR